MSKSDYLARIAGRLGFLTEADRADVLSDLDELYDGLAGKGMAKGAIEERIGAPEAVAAEYRFEWQLDRVDRTPNAAAGIRIGFAALTGRVARGAAFQLLGLVWLSLAVVALGVTLCMVAGAALAVAALSGFDPVVTTIAVPGIPVVSGALIGLAIAAAAFALLVVNRLAMRGLSRLMRERLGPPSRRPPTPAAVSPAPASVASVPSAASNAADAAGAESGRTRWIDSWRAAWHLLGAALVLAAVATALMLVVPAEEFPLSIDFTEILELFESATIEVRASKVDVRVVAGTTEASASARLTADLRRTFAQSTDLRVVPGGSTVVVEAVYREGLSWGINPRPLLTVTLPAGGPATDRVTTAITLREGGDADLSALPASIRGRVTVERGE